MSIENCKSCDNRYNDKEDCFKECVLTKLDNIREEIKNLKEEINKNKGIPGFTK